MTRTERNQYPAAVLKDRHSRSGLLKSELERKRGAGAHNWGSFAQEGQYESLADADAQRDIGDLDASDLVNNEGDEAELNADADADVLADLPSDQGGIGGTADETGINPDVPKDFTRETARAIVDANGVARSPTDSTSSLDSARGGQRRKSSVSEEEREKARLYRERAMHKGDLDLRNIAATSYGIAQSPPGASGFGTSPIKHKSFDLK